MGEPNGQAAVEIAFKAYDISDIFMFAYQTENLSFSGQMWQVEANEFSTLFMFNIT